MFVNQFTIDNGQVDILGNKQLLLPVQIIELLNDKKAYDFIKQTVKIGMDEEIRKIGSTTPLQRFNNLKDLMNTFGIGNIDVTFIDSKKQKAMIQINNSTIANYYISQRKKTTVPVCVITKAVLAGAFSSFFGKDVDSEETKCMSLGENYCQFSIK